MKLGIVLNSNDPETAWNALRLGIEALSARNEVSMFLLGNGVELENIKDKGFAIDKALKKFLDQGGKLTACEICLIFRRQESKVCPVSSMPELVKIIAESDKVVSFG